MDERYIDKGYDDTKTQAMKLEVMEERRGAFPLGVYVAVAVVWVGVIVAVLWVML
jgi:hypothetical protein